MTDAPVLQIPDSLKPADGRFGAGPSKIQTAHLDALAATGASLMGTSHRQAPVRDTATFGLIREKSQHLSFGEFSSKFASAAAAAPHLADPTVIKADPRSRPV